MAGKVVLVGAGPGDVGLITRRGQQWIERADVIVYDYLVNPALLDWAKPGAELIMAGKHGGGPRVEQEEIHRIVVTHARAGKIVVRLKGGDPLLFGRGGEEAEAARLAGIEVEIVPGVTSALAVPAYAGIPVTHRDWSSSVVIATGYEYPDKPELAVPWDVLGHPGQTVVLLMSQRQLRKNMERLLAAGRPPNTPVAVIQWGTRARQRTLEGTLCTIADRAEAAGIRPPVVVVVGEVVRLRQRLAWFEQKPLFGKTIVVTRPRSEAMRLAEILTDFGAEVIAFPTIEIAPPGSFEAFDRALQHPETFDWIVFTSANGVEAFARRICVSGHDIRQWHRAKIAAVGPQTARAAERLALKVDIVAPYYQAEGLAAALARENIAGARVFLPRAAGARPVLVEHLQRLGAEVCEVEAYRSVLPQAPSAPIVAEMLRAGEVDLVTFTSSSTVHNFVQLIREQQGIPVSGLPAACIGPITAATARSYGMDVRVEPPEFTASRLVQSIVEYFTQKGGGY
ncbi:MAG: uroporphyrinogen III methyltransferase [Candidatus Binatia bacterium]|nr:MAG: uroporphyrinogen III methyltransferase [Candidatus Binatia bacterium]